MLGDVLGDVRAYMYGDMHEGTRAGMRGDMHEGTRAGMRGDMLGGMLGDMHGSMCAYMYGDMHEGMRGGMRGGMREDVHWRHAWPVHVDIPMCVGMLCRGVHRHVHKLTWWIVVNRSTSFITRLQKRSNLPKIWLSLKSNCLTFGCSASRSFWSRYLAHSIGHRRTGGRT